MLEVAEELRHPRRRPEIGRLANPTVEPGVIDLRVEVPQARADLAEAARRVDVLQRVGQRVRRGVSRGLQPVRFGSPSGSSASA